MKNLFSIMSHLKTHYRFKLNFQKVDQNTGTKHRKVNQLQSLQLPCRMA